MATITKSCSLRAKAGANTSDSDAATLSFSEMSSYSNACTVTQLKADFAIWQEQKTNIQYALYYESTIQQAIAYADTTYPGSTHNRTITKNISKTPAKFVSDSSVQVAIGQNTPLLWGSDLTATVNVTVTYTPGCYVNWYPKDPSGTTNNWQDTYPKNNSNNITFLNLTVTGYKFNGWYTGTTTGQGTKTTSATADVYDLNYHGEWTKWYKVIFYDQNGNVVTTRVQKTLGTTGESLTPSSSVNPSMNGYSFQGWTRTPDSGKNYKVIYTNTNYSVDTIADNQVNGTAKDDGFEIKYYPVFKKEYQVIFNKVLNNASFSYTQSNYNNKMVGDIPTAPNAPTIATHQFLGWALDSSVTASTAVLSGTNQNCWTTIPAIADNQAGSTATSNGFPINYYAVWRTRDSITFKENTSTISSPVSGAAYGQGSYGRITVNNYNATENGIYYFDNSKSISFSYNFNTTDFSANEVYIDSITPSSSTTLTTNGVLANNRRSYTSGSKTSGTNGTAITITFNIYKNAQVEVYLYQRIKDRQNNTSINLGNNFSSTFSIDTIALPVSGTSWDFLSETFTITSGNSYVGKGQKIYLNPTDTVTCSTNCTDTDNRFYISQMLVPPSNSTNNMNTITWNPESTSTTGLTVVNRTALKNNAGTSNYPQLIDNSLISSQKKGSYQLAITTNHMGDINNHKIFKVFVEYEPFNCSFSISNLLYSPDILAPAYQENYFISDTSSSPYTYKFFNDITMSSDIHIRIIRLNNDTKHTVVGLSLDNEGKALRILSLKNGNTSGIDDYFYCDIYSTVHDYYLNNFTWCKIMPTQQMIENYHAIHTVEITWQESDYKCFIILKLPELGDSGVETADNNDVYDKVRLITGGWDHNSDLIKNRTIYYNEFLNTTQTSQRVMNATIYDIINTGYILKSIEKYSYNGNYNSDLTFSSITREQLDSGTSMPANLYITRTTDNDHNDILTFSRSALNSAAGQVDYYFITYEEGLPIFYPDSENNPKRAIQMYWEGNRVIGLYYENTRLL